MRVARVSGLSHVANKRVDCRTRVASFADEPWCAADNRHTAGILVSAASWLISARAGILGRHPNVVSEHLLLISSLIPIDKNIVTTPDTSEKFCLSLFLKARRVEMNER